MMAFVPQEIYTEISSELKAAIAGAFLCNESDRGVIHMKGNDARDLLHRLSSARIDDLKVGQLRETLLTSEKGRVIDVLLAAHGTDYLKLLTSSGRTLEVIAWLEKFTIMEDCEYENRSGSIAQFSIYNLSREGTSPFPDIELPEPGSFIAVRLFGINVEVLHHRSVTGAGIRILCRVEDAETLWLHLGKDAGLPFVGRHAHALWRVSQLLPAVGHELSDRANPLEAGAEAAVDFRKGCFIGQEVIARLDSYDKVQRHPRRLLFASTVPIEIAVGTELLHVDGNAGFVSTAVYDPIRERMVGIGLLRLAFESVGTKLRCVDIDVEVAV
jgi:folate-binding protein YgfZ